MFKNITVPIDGSKYSYIAVDYAIELALKFDSNLNFVHVLNEFSYNNYDNEENNGNEILKKASDKALSLNINVRDHLITGDPLRDMKTIIDKTSADLVVLHSYGNDFVDKNQIGSISTRILNTVNVPILLIKGDEII